MLRERIELAFFQGCPHAAEARENLVQALQRLGTDADWVEWDLEDPRTPADVRRYGSPTVLVDRVDVTGSEGDPAHALACRADGAPSADQISAALERSTV